MPVPADIPADWYCHGDEAAGGVVSATPFTASSAQAAHWRIRQVRWPDEVVEDYADPGTVWGSARIGLNAAQMWAMPLRRRLAHHNWSSPIE